MNTSIWVPSSADRFRLAAVFAKTNLKTTNSAVATTEATIVTMKVMNVRIMSGRVNFLEVAVLKVAFSAGMGLEEADGGRVVVVEGTEKGVRKMQRKVRTAETRKRANIQLDALRARSRAECMSPGRATIDGKILAWRLRLRVGRGRHTCRASKKLVHENSNRIKGIHGLWWRAVGDPVSICESLAEIP